VAHRKLSSTLRFGVERQRRFVQVTWRAPSLVEKLLSGDGIKVTKRAWRVPSCSGEPFVASQVVLLERLGDQALVRSVSTTWTGSSLVPIDTTG
jgi:hypothetical protein